MNGTRTEPIEILHDVDVTVIPSGEPFTLHRGDRVLVTQALGGNVTVQTESGHLARIAGTDAVALGLTLAETIVPDNPAAAGGEHFEMERVIDQLRTVFDPEIPVNVVDLGLIYSCDAEPLPDGSHRVDIKMSMTAPGCGMGDVLRDDAHHRVAALPGVAEVNVEIVWDPPWGIDRMSDAARLQLGML
jgi:probable FeS assembly SUF system protein SufT